MIRGEVRRKGRTRSGEEQRSTALSLVRVARTARKGLLCV